MKKLLALTLTIFMFSTPQAWSQEESSLEDSYDPFADYSDFVEASNQETDVNFFKFGRLLSIGVTLGYRGFSGPQTEIYQPSASFGAFFTYYMGMQFAFQLGFVSSTHDVVWAVPEEDIRFEGTTRYNNFSFHGKYFLNTQNLTKSIARFNPFFIGGVSQYTRETQRPAEIVLLSKQTSVTVDIGLGAEYLFNNNKNFITVQGMFYKTNFPDQNDAITVDGGNGTEIETGLKAKGGIFNISIMAGFNF